MAWCARIALLLSVLAWSAQPALAQTFWQPMFGAGPSPRPYVYPGPYPGMSPYRLPGFYGSPFSPYRPNRGDEDGRPLERGGGFRTLCVRLCDGFYFPISSAAPQSSFARDADSCSASCGDEARLFYHPNVGGDVDTMVDLRGMAYSALPNAFKYRKTLVEDCRCRPQPWSEAELERHRAYAQGRAPDSPGSPRVVVGIEQRTPAADDPRGVPRPAPIVREDLPAWPYPSAGNAGTPKSRYIWPFRN